MHIVYNDYRIAIIESNYFEVPDSGSGTTTESIYEGTNQGKLSQSSESEAYSFIETAPMAADSLEESNSDVDKDDPKPNRNVNRSFNTKNQPVKTGSVNLPKLDNLNKRGSFNQMPYQPYTRMKTHPVKPISKRPRSPNYKIITNFPKSPTKNPGLAKQKGDMSPSSVSNLETAHS